MKKHLFRKDKHKKYKFITKTVSTGIFIDLFLSPFKSPWWNNVPVGWTTSKNRNPINVRDLLQAANSYVARHPTLSWQTRIWGVHFTASKLKKDSKDVNWNSAPTPIFFLYHLKIYVYTMKIALKLSYRIYLQYFFSDRILIIV